jgi:TP901 family phage tail tape measure protein
MAKKKITYVYGADLSDLERGWKRIERKMGRMSANMQRYGSAMTKAFTVPLAAVGGVATKAAYDVDKALQKIARGTGAQGEDLKGLEKTWRSLAKSVTQSFEESAQVLADYNTRLGLTGEKLEGLSKQALDAARMLGEDVNTVVSQSAKAMQDWGVAVEDQSAFMDRLFKAAQATGIQMGTLSTQLYKYGAGLRGMGFDLESSVALLAKFEKQGVNVEKIMGSLSMGLGRMAKEGVTDAEEAFKQLMQEIQSAENVTEATRLAIEVFGSRAGPDMALAIREGRFSVEELIAVLREADGVIQQTSDSTDKFGEKWARAKNNILLALEPIGREILNIAESAMPRLEAAADKAATSIGEMSDETKKKILILAGTMAAGGPLLLAVSAVANSFRNLGGLMLGLFGPAGPWVLGIATVWALIDAYRNLDQIQKKITGMAPQEALDRNAYMEQAGEIFHERHGKYPATATDYEKLDAIIDELIAAEQKARQATTDLGAKVQESVQENAVDVAAQVQQAVTPIPEAAQTTVSAVDEVTAAGERALSVYERLAHEIDSVLAADEYKWRYEGGPIPTHIHKEQEWDRAEMESAARIGQQVAAEMDKVKDKTDAVGQSYENLVTKGDMWAKSLSDGIADAIVQGRSLMDVLAQIGQQLVKMLISKALSSIFTGLFSFHEGGVVGSGGKKTFRGFRPIKRYHSGGLIGNDEEMAILQKGERVIPRDTPGAVVINVLDKSDLERVTYEAMAKYPGVQIVTNHVMRNMNERGALATGVK